MNSRVIDVCPGSNVPPFKRLNISSIGLCAAFAVIGFFGVAQPASAATILVNGSGQLIGATGVNVAGTSYDVSFTDGTCAAAYDGCDAVADFLFTTQTEAAVASQALLDQVFVDGASGLFDTVPGLTFGCLTTSSACYAFTPYGFRVTTRLEVLSAGAINRIIGDGRNFGATEPTTDFARLNQGIAYAGYSFIWADWSPAAASIPEPGSILLLATGLAGAGLRRWRRNRR